MKNQYVAKLNVDIPAARIHVFFPLLQQGFMVETRVGCSIKTMLCQVLGLDDNYVEDRIKTIFLDGKPVDDINTALIKDGSILALSGAMPGLAGATLRRGGRLASFRSSISYQSDGKSSSSRDGHVFVKLFNLLIKDFGPLFLKKGILIRKDQFEDILDRWSEDVGPSLDFVYLDGRKISLDARSQLVLPEMIHLSVNPED